MTSPPVGRVIPRPSERRREVTVDDLVIVDHEHDQGLTRTRISSAGEATDALSTTMLVCGWVTTLAAATAFGVLGLTDREDTTLGAVLVPLVAAGAFISLRRGLVGRGEQLSTVLFAAFGLRLLAAVPRLIGGADSPVYQREGERIADALMRFDFGVEIGRSVPGTGSVRYLSGVVNVFTGSTFIATYLVFVAIAFVGQVFFLLGVHHALTPRQFRFLSVLIAFSPSLAFWPSSIGKESLSLFGIGMTVYGASHLYERRWSGAGPVLFGLFAVGMIRPHVALVVLIGVLIGLFARRAHTRGRLATHSALLVIVLVAAMVITNASANLFGLESLDGFSDVSAALDFAQERTSQDEAQFVAARVESIADYPRAAATVMFRPFPWEVSNGVALISAIEGSVLLVLVLRALPGCFVHVADILQRGQLLLGVAFTSVFIYLFSAIGNFGILSRQRSQVLPFILLFVAFGVKASTSRAQRVSRR